MRSVDRVLRFMPRKSKQRIDACLRLLVHDAFAGVPYYRRTWSEAGIAPEAIGGIEDLQRLPLVTKEHLLARGLSDRLRRDADVKNTVSRLTSGMTGGNLQVFMSRAELQFRQLSLFRRMWRDSGFAYPMTLVQAGTWMPMESDTGLERRRTPMGTVVHISRRQPLEEQIRAIAACRPTVLTGCPSVLEIIACALTDLPGTQIRPRLVVTRGEVLRPATRRLLADMFSCSVTNYYSAEEFGLIAWQCPTSPEIMHVNRSSCLLEVVDDDGNPSPPGHDGTVVATNLFNRTMPLIRYVLGDQTAVIHGDVDKCRCGGELLSIRTPAGRSEDFITLPDGQRVSPRILDDLIYDASAARGLDHPFYQSVRDYQAIQDTPHSIRVLYLTDSAIPAFVSEVLKRGFRALHPALTCEARAIETLASAESGKRRRVVSNL